MPAQEDCKRRVLPLIVRGPLVVALVMLLLPLVPLLLTMYLVYGIVLQLVIWICWVLAVSSVATASGANPSMSDLCPENGLAPIRTIGACPIFVQLDVRRTAQTPRP